MTGIVMVFQTIKKNSIYETTLILVGLVSLFVHIIYGINDAEGIFGYTYMSSFLNAAGRISFQLCTALYIKRLVYKVKDEYQSSVNMVANMCLFVASFFLINLIVPKKMLFGKPDFPPYYYWISMVALCIMSVFLLRLIDKSLATTEEKFKKAISKIFDFIFVETEDSGFIKEDKLQQYEKRTVEVVDETMQTIKN